MKYSASIIGAGSYGTALAVSLTRNGKKVLLWAREADCVLEMRKSRSDIILLAVPSKAFGEVLREIRPYMTPGHKVVWATKGLESGTGRLLSEVAEEILGSNIPFAVISGPTFARELATGLPTAIAVSGNNDAFIREFSEIIHSSKNFRVYPNPDFIGVQIGGTVKNVIAIGTGLSDGLGFGANARTALITRGLVEMQRLGVAMGARPVTFMGMAGLGDLVLTCTDNQSRNRRFGLALGQGATPEEAMKSIGQAVEGWYNTKEVHALSEKLKVDMPICEEIYQVLFNGKSAKDATATLLSRRMKDE